jgi:branched-chain amino acid transport system substrate-binding protein
MQGKRWTGPAVLVTAMLLVAACGGADATSTTEAGGNELGSKPAVTVGMTGVRVGPIPAIGRGVGDALKDWFAMVNDQGGIDGREVVFEEIESEYAVPKAVEAYTKLKQDGAVAVIAMGTPLAAAIIPMSQADKIITINPGVGLVDSVDGTKFPYAMPATPTYAAQMSALTQWAVNDWKDKGKSGQPKLACIGWDNPAGKEGCSSMEAAAKVLKADAVASTFIPPAAVDAGPQVLEVKQADPDYILTGTGGKTPTLVVNGVRDAGLDVPLLTWHWGLSQDEIEAGGDNAEGYMGSSMAKMPQSDPKALQMLRDWWKESGTTPNPVADEVFYGQGLVIATMLAKALDNASAEAGDGEITGDLLKTGYESIKDFDGYGVACPTTITANDHGGVRAVNIYRVEKGKFVLVEDCIEGPKLDTEP